jgi:hypothetical protein
MAETGQETTRFGGGYERRDMSPRTVAAFFGGLVICVAVVLLLMAWLFDYFAARAARRDVPPSPLAEARQIPPEPRLQVNPGADLKALRAAEDSVLNRYGWVDQPAGIVRIPIARAMDLLAERGLPPPAKGPAKRAGKP